MDNLSILLFTTDRGGREGEGTVRRGKRFYMLRNGRRIIRAGCATDPQMASSPWRPILQHKQHVRRIVVEMEVEVTLEPNKSDLQEWSDDDVLMVKLVYLIGLAQLSSQTTLKIVDNSQNLLSEFHYTRMKLHTSLISNIFEWTMGNRFYWLLSFYTKSN